MARARPRVLPLRGLCASAEVQGVVDDASSLQDELQGGGVRCKGCDGAEAIARMEDFQRESVGQERVHSTKPLQHAKTRLAAAERRSPMRERSTLTGCPSKRRRWG